MAWYRYPTCCCPNTQTIKSHHVSPGLTLSVQEIARMVVRTVSAVLSMLDSLDVYVLRLICKKWRDKRSSVDLYQQIMAGLCMYIIMLFFFWWFMGSCMMPAATGWWGTAGNSQSCTTQGALMDFALIGIWVSSTKGRFVSICYLSLDFPQPLLVHARCDHINAVVSNTAVSVHAAPCHFQVVAKTN